MNANDNRLEDLKYEKDLKSKEIADMLKVNESTYSEWEHNRIPIPTKRLIELADIYKVNIDYMLKLNNVRKYIPKKTSLDLNMVGIRLKEIRQYMNLSLREWGEKLNYSFSTLASYERGEKLINSEILINISNITNYSLDWILGRTEEKQIKNCNE